MVKVLSKQYFWLIIILILAFSVRLYKIDSPIADWHSWRQADTAAVTRNFLKYGFNPFLPRGDDMSVVSDSSIANANTYRFVEFPIYNIVAYFFYLRFGVNETIHRLVSVLFSLGNITFLYLICRKYFRVSLCLLVAGIYAFLPFNIYFSRTTLPEPTFLFFALGMIYFVEQWIWNKKRSSGIWGFIFTTIAFLIKPWAIFFVPPLIYSIFKKEGNFKKNLHYLWFFLAAILPFLVWRLWMLQAPEGIPASNWLMNGDHIRFRPAFWWWLISERIGREILGVSGAVLFFLGLISHPKEHNYFFHIWVFSLFTYFAIFATGNVRHDYYQFIFIPIAAIFVAFGFEILIKGSKNLLPRIWTIPLGVLLLILTFYFTWIQVKELYKVNNPDIVEAGKVADRILPKDAVVVAPYNGDTAFLYQINRIGFPLVPLSLQDLIADYGVNYYISVSYDDKTNWVIRHFEVLERTPKFMIADLTHIKAPFDNSADPEP